MQSERAQMLWEDFFSSGNIMDYILYRSAEETGNDNT